MRRPRCRPPCRDGGSRGRHARSDLRLFPDQRVNAGHGLPVELHQAGLALRVDQPEGVDAKAFHRPVRARNAAVAHVPEDVVGGLCVQGNEVPEAIVCRLGLWDLTVRLGLAGVNDVGELDAVLDEEDGHVIAHQVERAFVGVNFTAKPRVSRTVSAEPREPSTVENRTKTSVCLPLARNPALVTEAAVP